MQVVKSFDNQRRSDSLRKSGCVLVHEVIAIVICPKINDSNN